MEDFSQLEKPWPMAIAENRYLSSRVSLKVLAEESGNSFEAIRHWSIDRNWKQKRKDFQIALCEEVEESLYATLKKVLAKDFAEILFGHWKIASTGRELFGKRFQAELDELNAVEDKVKSGDLPPEHLLDYHRKMNIRDLVLLSGAFEKIVQVERSALGIPEIENLDKAVAMLEQSGYVVLPQDSWDEARAILEADQPVLEGE